MTALSELAMGGKGRVTQVRGVDDVSLRLMEMGLTPGVELSLIGAAPLGDPIELDVLGYRLSIRRSEAALVEIEIVEIDIV
ncbi:MAG: ferrous iron transport protein A [Planctomycetia bacterium]|nr:ferrous iron transport protein A [Planctomycetia bacterium]